MLEKLYEWKENQNSIVLLLVLIGVIVSYKTIRDLVKRIYFIYCKPYDFKERYGANSWVVITGSTDGIGKEFAIQYAQLGYFNLVCVARNEQKLKKVEEELKQINKDIKIKNIVANFVDGLESDFYQKIERELEGLDISTLVNNVGIADMQRTQDLKDDFIKDCIVVNVFSYTLLTKMLVPKMLKREKRSAIINISSNSALSFKPYSQLYSGTKAFNLAFSNCLEIEVDKQIDVIGVCPSMVETPIHLSRTKDLNLLKKIRFFLMISPTQFVYSVFQQLGRVSFTRGHIKHYVIAFVFSILSERKTNKRQGEMMLKQAQTNPFKPCKKEQ